MHSGYPSPTADIARTRRQSGARSNRQPRRLWQSGVCRPCVNHQNETDHRRCRRPRHAMPRLHFAGIPRRRCAQEPRNSNLWKQSGWPRVVRAGGAYAHAALMITEAEETKGEPRSD